MAAILNCYCYLVILDHPRSLLHGPNIVLNLISIALLLSDIWPFEKNLQILLMSPIPAPKISVLGDFDP